MVAAKLYGEQKLSSGQAAKMLGLSKRAFIELLTLPRLRNHQLQTVSENSINICAGISQLEAPLTKVTEELDKFKIGMTKEKASAVNKKELDTDRDNLTANFVRSVNAESNFPYSDPAKKDTMKQLLKVVHSYGLKITRLSYNEESAALDNFINDVKKIDLAPLSETGLARWIPLIENANNSFKSAVREYINDTSNTSLIESASAAAPGLMDALDGLFSMLYAYIKTDGSDELKKAYTQLQTLLDSYR